MVAFLSTLGVVSPRSHRVSICASRPWTLRLEMAWLKFLRLVVAVRHSDSHYICLEHLGCGHDTMCIFSVWMKVLRVFKKKEYFNISERSQKVQLLKDNLRSNTVDVKYFWLCLLICIRRLHCSLGFEHTACTLIPYHTSGHCPKLRHWFKSAIHY